MLALTPEPLQTAGERAVFAELARWDTGAAVRPAVVASLPLVDGPMGRRISDAVLFVPEGLAVVRIAEVPRQRGMVTAVPEGSWSIAPDAGPGEVLQIAGGGSSPLDGLMRSGMEAAFRLRQAGLEPGRIARLTVLVGDLSGLQPADGDLGEGDQVALLESRSLLLGIARAARYAGVDNPRLWTTADVRTALEVLGLPGRGPSVEELNGEGFPYSPYVLRRRDLLTPATMNAASAAATAAAQAAEAAAASAAPPAAAAPSAPAAPAAPAPRSGGPVTGGFVAAGPHGPRVDPAAAAAVAAAAIRADEAAAAHRAAVAAQAQQAPATSPAYSPAPAPASPAAEETDGIGGLFARSEGTDPGAAGAPRTLVAPVVALPAERPAGVPLVVARKRPDRTRRLALVAGGAALLVVLLVVGLVLALSGGGDGDDARADTDDPAPTSAAATEADGPQPGDTRELDGATLTLQRVRVDDSCAEHSYGLVAEFFSGTDCAGLARALWSTEVEGRAVVVSVAAVDMADARGADALRALTDANGSGNVSDLLREGVRYPGGPEALSRAEYASAVEGAVVTIVEAAWVGPAGSASDLDVLAGTGLSLPMPDPAP
ncbi:hypothetical protein [Trujillonella endophytica]|uniref:Uncharacterized protein n=1 Tax=Trujillonella endophytica TaxID=673521 RepID=A0A1H8R5G3_9ACTN|nr:hypothetical protein [Trujillella endophytica]SEO61557.1 hypothetical protein SAMN05660991_01010 [Trujillella endophytica]